MSAARIALCLLVASASPAVAQHSHVEVRPDRVVIGNEFVPRFLDLPHRLIVARGASAELPAGTYDYIEVGGRLTIPAVTVRVTHLIVLPGGSLTVECGAQIIGRDVPIDSSRDPFQWGNGLINFGERIMACPEKTGFAQVVDAPEGATTITLAETPVGWVAGDELVLPDTRQVVRSVRPRREAQTTIAEISGNTIVLSRPLAFARAPIRRPDGSVVLRPRVANVTRRTVIRSENPNGVRWHTANIGPSASWDVQGVAFVGLGRTRNEPVDSTGGDLAHTGTNQIGRYADHDHHAGSSLAVRRSIGNAYVGLGGGKWAKVVHQTHDTEILNNVCVDTPGGCFITEDGNEVRNVITGNFAAYVSGNGHGSAFNVGQKCPGCESAYWFRGVHNTFDGNEAWNSQVGFNLFNQSHLAKGLPIPNVKGGAPTGKPDLGAFVPVSMKGNVSAANWENGLEYWSLVPFPAERFVAAHNGERQVFNAAPERSAELSLVDASIICSDDKSFGLESANGYTHGVEMLRGEIRGCWGGIIYGIARMYGRFTETVFQNVKNLVFIQPQSWPRDLRFTRVKHEPLRGHPLTYLWFDLEPAWAGGTTPLPGAGSLAWGLKHHGSRIVIEDWQGTGKDYRLVTPAQARNLPAWVATDSPAHVAFPPPECGTTLGDVWDRCGMGYGGDAFAANEAVSLEGVINQVGVPHPRPPLGAPRAIMTSPQSSFVARPKPEYGNRIPLYFALTGDPNAADGFAYIQIDRGPVVTVRNGVFMEGWVWYQTEVTAPGVHAVRTWRQKNGQEVPNSVMTFSYVVGDGANPSPPPASKSDSCKDTPPVPTVSVTQPGSRARGPDRSPCATSADAPPR